MTKKTTAKLKENAYVLSRLEHIEGLLTTSIKLLKSNGQDDYKMNNACSNINIALQEIRTLQTQLNNYDTKTRTA
jgi:hypothetical protein